MCLQPQTSVFRFTVVCESGICSLLYVHDCYGHFHILRYNVSPPGGTLSSGSRVRDFRLVKEPQA